LSATSVPEHLRPTLRAVSIERKRERENHDHHPPDGHQRRVLSTTAAAIFAFLGLIDIALLGIVGSSIASSLAVSIVVAELGLVMLVALTPARNGSRPTLVTAITARVISAVLAVAAFFADAPAWIMAVETFLIAATLIAVVLLRREPRLQGA
jgi:hypothetical protein